MSPPASSVVFSGASGPVRSLVLAGALLAPSLTCGCIDTDPAVFVEARITAPSVSAAPAPGGLVTSVDGSFTLELHLGPRASDESQIGLGAFSITNANRSGTLVPSLTITSGQSFPVTVGIDSDVAVPMSFTEEESADLFAEICAAGQVAIVGTLDDSLRGAAIDVASDPVAVAGCP